MKCPYHIPCCFALHRESLKSSLFTVSIFHTVAISRRKMICPYSAGYRFFLQAPSPQIHSLRISVHPFSHKFLSNIHSKRLTFKGCFAEHLMEKHFSFTCSRSCSKRSTDFLLAFFSYVATGQCMFKRVLLHCFELEHCTATHP